jgi:DNA-binding NarL/FixJ family response regulator
MEKTIGRPGSWLLNREKPDETEVRVRDDVVEENQIPWHRGVAFEVTCEAPTIDDAVEAARGEAEATKERVFDVAILVDALRRIADGETVVDPTIVSRLVGRRRREDPLTNLTEREREVLSLGAEGLSNKAIAGRLFVTERTVEAHVKQVFLKLHLTANPDSHRRVLAVLAYLRTAA